MTRWFELIRKNPVLLWVLLFIAVNVGFRMGQWINPIARFITLSAMVEDTSFKVDRYRNWTVDWSQGPDGHFYSNKAPGPTLIAYPAFWVMDKWLTRKVASLEERDRVRENFAHLELWALSLLFQVLPASLLMLLLAHHMKTVGLSTSAITLTAVLTFFGSTVSLFMNSYFGHALTAQFVVVLFFALFYKRSFWIGFFYGWALLSDYGVSLLLFPVILLLFWDRKEFFHKKELSKMVLGALLPAGLWIAYHIVCFDSPFSIAMKYQNPELVDVTRDEGGVWGILKLIPRLDVVGQLIFGTSRGILFTQPWLLLLFAAAPFALNEVQKRNRAHYPFTIRLLVFFGVGFILLLWMHASFASWYAGLSPGPRYVSPVLIGLAIVAGYLFDFFPQWIRTGLWMLTIPSVIFFAMVMNATHLAPRPPQALWSHYWPIAFPQVRFWILASALLALMVLTWMRKGYGGGWRR